MIFWGPPGSGKTTIANILARSVRAPFFSLSAISAGVKDLCEAIEAAREANKTSTDRSVLFIDEVHRFSKSQQDALLGAVEHGVVTLIGATTENPSFEVISPLLSRARVIESGEDLEFIARRMIIFASEDIGNADPNALLLAMACWDAVRAVGYPE